MAEPLHRTQILLRKEQHEELRALAAHRGVSVSELIRDLVDQRLQNQDDERRDRIDRKLRALAEIESHCREALGRRGGKPLVVDLGTLIAENRDERDDEIIGRLAVGRD